MTSVNNTKTDGEKVVREFLVVKDGDGTRRVACQRSKAKTPRILWLGGYKSDMNSGKALAVGAWAEANSFSFSSFDYSGHGKSCSDMPGERFLDGNISRWLADAVAVTNLDPDPFVVVGSSMGGWLALLLEKLLRKTGRIKALILIAPAIDFTEKLLWARFSDEIKHEIETNGVWFRVNKSGEAHPFTKNLIEDGRQNQILDGPIEPNCPVHILQGQLDPDVPLAHVLQLVQTMPLETVLTIIRDGDHRLSRDQDISLLIKTLERVLAEI